MKEVKYIPGDLVTNHKGTVLRIVDRVTGFLNTEYQDGSPGLYINRKDVAPIPLTPKILEDNGWKKNEYGVYYKNFNPHKAICLSKEDGSNWEVSACGVTLIHCKFVHDLQHLLFGLGLNSELNV